MWVTITVNFGETWLGERHTGQGVLTAECGSRITAPRDGNHCAPFDHLFPRPNPDCRRTIHFQLQLGHVGSVKPPGGPTCGRVLYRQFTYGLPGMGIAQSHGTPSGATIDYTMRLMETSHSAGFATDAPQETIKSQRLSTHDGVADTWTYGNSPRKGRGSHGPGRPSSSLRHSIHMIEASLTGGPEDSPERKDSFIALTVPGKRGWSVIGLH